MSDGLVKQGPMMPLSRELLEDALPGSPRFTVRRLHGRWGWWRPWLVERWDRPTRDRHSTDDLEDTE